MEFTGSQQRVEYSAARLHMFRQTDYSSAPDLSVGWQFPPDCCRPRACHRLQALIWKPQCKTITEKVPKGGGDGRN
jgi:hypothetical protein